MKITINCVENLVEKDAKEFCEKRNEDWGKFKYACAYGSAIAFLYQALSLLDNLVKGSNPLDIHWAEEFLGKFGE